MISKKLRELTWSKAKKARGMNPNLYRRDPFGNLVYKPSYGKTSKLGWEIDHKHPKKRGGTDKPHNLQVLHWKVNREKGSKYPFIYKKKSKRKRK